MTLLLMLIACRTAVVVGPEGGDDSDVEDTSPVDTQDTSPPPLPTVVVNELMPDNRAALPDADGVFHDWIELHNTGPDEVYLGGLCISDDYDDRTLHTLPTSLSIPAGGWLILYATGDAQADDQLPFRLDADGEGVGVFLPDGTPVDWVVFGSADSDHAHARVPDGAAEWVTMPVGTPGETNVVLEWSDVVMIEAGATWSYDDSGTDLGTTWRSGDFDDSGWATGAAPLGYGDGHIVTEISFGEESGNKNPTTYFRTSVSLDAVPTEVELELLVDDAAVVWVNGNEAYRTNLPDGDISYGTYGLSAASGSNETDYESAELDPSLFVAGENQIAVEVHQATAGSSDLGFDVALGGRALVEVD
jgi:hypothetical protein